MKFGTSGPREEDPDSFVYTFSYILQGNQTPVSPPRPGPSDSPIWRINKHRLCDTTTAKPPCRQSRSKSHVLSNELHL